MSKYEELCQVFANARKEAVKYKHSCQDFADFLVHRMSMYFGCAIATGEIRFYEDGNLHLQTSLTLYENPQDTANSACETITIDLSIIKKCEDFLVAVLPYGSEFTIPSKNMNKLDELFEFIADKIRAVYENDIELLVGECEKIRSLGWNF
ncbi:MAG: hypothetical protein SAL07_02725 [Oscillatoria sp. PMC 1051.18]|uniref:hypothetical protein n=1 Tax=Oscillatoria salina TaxID=331517 RepID=UPI0013B6F1C9|nr:hypothetical protein [Oscillatoria salina]MBZ8182944.1 hypothetical protein [Oscillatoria salina IIICB1]MEC4892269.1 hypothetical protein [Oscillatoria sp. PMC 1050.18]MEC5028802.1 hypothetical protein [Oscillatoria sp. PMC 1051.18]NET86549.1 hypothetical protein [Kamptonema sp. SIO1D9]